MKMILKILQIKLCIYIDLLLKYIPFRTRHHYDIIIIRTDGIGDFIMWAGAIPAYRRYYSGKSIAFIHPSNYSTIVEQIGLFDKSIPLDKKGYETNIFSHLKTVFFLKRFSANTVINPTNYRIFPSDIFVGMIKAQDKIGVYHKQNPSPFNIWNNYYTKTIKLPDGCNNEMLISEYFTNEIVGGDYKHNLFNFGFIEDFNDKSLIQPYCVVALSSTDKVKIWEIEKVNELLKFIPTKYMIALCGYGEEDEKRASYIINNQFDASRICNFVGKTSMLDIVKIVSKSSFVLGNDSSTIHIAAACRVRSVCYMTGATYNEFLPYPSKMDDKVFHPRVVVKPMKCFGCHYICTVERKKEYPSICLKNVTVEMVKNELNQVILELNN